MKSIFQQFKAGLVTGKDDVLTDFDRQILSSRMKHILSAEPIPELEPLLNNSAGRKILAKRKTMKFDDQKILGYHYRPFDLRYVYYSPEIMERPRHDIMHNLLHENLGIIVSRINTKKEFDSVIATRFLPDYKLGESTRGSYLFPLYLYDEGKMSSAPKQTPNFTKEFYETIKQRYSDMRISTEEIFGYVYAVLHSPKFRRKYRSSLKIDFPRIPFAHDQDVFRNLSRIGQELLRLHCVQTKLATHVGFNIAGSNSIDFVSKDKDKVFINKTQFFEPIREDEWKFTIGGYQVLDKWLKARKGRTLTSKDVEQFLQIGQIIRRTIELEGEIDNYDFMEG